MQSPTKKFSIESPSEKHQKAATNKPIIPTTDHKPNLKSVISEMGVHEKSPDYKACVQLLEGIRRNSKEKEQQSAEIVDLVSLAESPQKHIMEVLVVANIQSTNVDVEEKRDDLEEHQEKHNKGDQEIEVDVQQTEK